MEKTNKRYFNGKKGLNEVGIGIIVMGLLLFVGAVFFDSSNSITQKQSYIQSKDANSNTASGNVDDVAKYLFYLENMDIGRQKKVTESFPNIELGAKEENNIIYIGNSFRLSANPLNKISKTFNINVKKPTEITEMLIYFNPQRLSGENELIIKFGDTEVARTLAKASDIPIRVPINIKNSNVSYIPVTFELVKPKGYELFNWNKLDILDLKITEVRRDESNNYRDFDFTLNKEFLERVSLDLVISCDQVKEVSEPIKVVLNGYIIGNQNPNCISRENRISINNISLNILGKVNRLVFETEGYYKVAYSINKVYYNDQETYKFNINSFNDIIDVVMYGDFDKDIIDLRLNGQTMTLRRDQVKSVIPYLRYGTNEIKFLTKPLEIKEFFIERNEFSYNN